MKKIFSAFFLIVCLTAAGASSLPAEDQAHAESPVQPSVTSHQQMKSERSERRSAFAEERGQLRRRYLAALQAGRQDEAKELLAQLEKLIQKQQFATERDTQQMKTETQETRETMSRVLIPTGSQQSAAPPPAPAGAVKKTE